MGAVNSGNFNLGNYVNQTDYTVDKSRRFAMKAGSNSIVGLNASITLKTSNVLKTCYFTLNIAQQTCDEERAILRCCNAARPDFRYQRLYTNLFLEYRDYKQNYNNSNCVPSKNTRASALRATKLSLSGKPSDDVELAQSYTKL
jgi:hypothetical protein